MWLRLARLPPPASRVRRSRRLRDTLALRHAYSRTLRSQKQQYFVRWVQTLGTRGYHVVIVLGFTPQYPRLRHSEGRLLWLHFSTRFPARPPSLPRAKAAHNCVFTCYVQAERKQPARSRACRLQNANIIQIWDQQLCVSVCLSVTGVKYCQGIVLLPPLPLSRQRPQLLQGFKTSVCSYTGALQAPS